MRSHHEGGAIVFLIELWGKEECGFINSVISGRLTTCREMEEKEEKRKRKIMIWEQMQERMNMIEL